MFDIKSYLAGKSALINKELEKRLPAEGTRPAILHRAMRYSVLAGGKRLRPILCLAAAEAVGGKEKNALVPALALEVLHTYTLIHDDLPCMDNDDLRRGKPTSHVVFGEANAILAGDALLTLAFEWLAAVPDCGGTRLSRPTIGMGNNFSRFGGTTLIRELAWAAGSRGVIGGQVEDLASEGKKPGAAKVAFIHRHKTAALIRAAVRMGGICGGAGKNELSALGKYGEKAGVAFQIADDMLNETSAPASLGKAAGSDRARGKMTYVAVHGIAQAKKMARKLAEEAKNALKTMKGDTEPLVALVDYIVARRL